MSAFLVRDGVVPNKVLPADGAKLDCEGAVVSFARESLGVDPSKCGAHITGIARKQHQHREIFTTREAYDTFYEWLFRASKYPHPASAARLQEKIVEYLKEQDQREAAIWFERNMTGENGKWMVAHGFLGAANNNMGQESFYKYMKKATLGKMGSHLLSSLVQCAGTGKTSVTSKLQRRESRARKVRTYPNLCSDSTGHECW